LSNTLHKKKHLQDKLEEVQAKFLHLLEVIPEREMDKKWVGEGWTIKEELMHMVQVVEVIPKGIERASKGGKRSLLGFVPTDVRGWVNGYLIVPRKAKNETRETIARAYREAHKNLLNQLEKLREDDWEKGMPYPRKYRTIEQMAYRPVEHFEEHASHIHRLLEMKNEPPNPT
jgi:hypothetical protein